MLNYDYSTTSQIKNNTSNSMYTTIPRESNLVYVVENASCHCCLIMSL